MGGIEAEPTWLCATTDRYDNTDGHGKHCSVAGMLGVEQSKVDAVLGNKYVDFLKGKAWSTWRTFPRREHAPPANEIWIWVYPHTTVIKSVEDVIKLTCSEAIYADKKQLQKDYTNSGTGFSQATVGSIKQRRRESLGNRQANKEAANSFLPVSAHNSQSTRYACTRETHTNSLCRV